MFTGIIETEGTIQKIVRENTNIHFGISSNIANELHPDQSVAHNGVCLTVTKVETDLYWVTAIQETLNKTNLQTWEVNTKVNIERCTKVGDRLDGHIVQGHADQTAQCIEILDQQGSWLYTFEYVPNKYITVEKGSITVNGVSLTVLNSRFNKFSVAIIPYTYHHTNFKDLKVGMMINVEFDIIGKYVQGLLKQ